MYLTKRRGIRHGTKMNLDGTTRKALVVIIEELTGEKVV